MVTISPFSTQRSVVPLGCRPAPSPVHRPSAPAPDDHGHAPVMQTGSQGRAIYLKLLTWAFTLFNSVRMLAYLPTTWAIVVSGDSSQHSLWTWCTWLGANLTMAAWLHEHNGRRMDKAVMVNIGNTTMCLLTVVVILMHRL